MLNFVYFLVGVLVTLVCAFIPFLKSSRQLSREAERLATLANLITRAMEESGFAKFTRNPSGEAIGPIFDQEIRESIGFSAASHPVGRGPEEGTL